MVKKEDKQGKIVLLLVMTFVILAVVVTVLATVQRGVLVKKINQNKAVLAEKSKEALVEEHAAELGWNKMIGGNLTKVDLASNMIEVDVDPHGTQQKYQIQFDKMTEVVREKRELIEANCDEQEEDCVQEFKTSFEEVATIDLAQGQLVQIHFPKRVDLENSKDLSAVKIVVLPN